jgi:hypothetical protein
MNSKKISIKKELNEIRRARQELKEEFNKDIDILKKLWT